MTTLLSWLGKLWLRLSGWKIVGNPLPADHYVFVAAYHTSNWDFPICMATRSSVKSPVCWIGKHQLFYWPLGPFMRLLGGVPINRSKKTDMVGQIVAEFKKHKRFGVAIFPEGTRKKVPRWKTGFYQIAMQAGVPIQPACLDYKTKSFYLGPLFYPSGDYQRDMEFLKPFWSVGTPKYPDKADMNFDTSAALARPSAR